MMFLDRSLAIYSFLFWFYSLFDNDPIFAACAWNKTIDMAIEVWIP